MKYLFLIIGFFFITSCANKGGTPSGILDKEKMQSVMWDIIRAEAFTDQFIKKDSSKNVLLENIQLQAKIFSIHKVSREQYDKSYAYYFSHTDLIRVVLDSMTAKAERERNGLYQQIEVVHPIEKFSIQLAGKVAGQFKYSFNPFWYSIKK